MSHRPHRLGVVVLNWNGRVHLEPCLRSLRLQDHPDHFVIVVDNGSTDGSADLVRETYTECELVALDENRRFAGGNNAGARRALERGAEVVLLLNNDTEASPGFLSALSAGFDDPAVSIVGPRIVFADDPSKIWYGGGLYSWPLAWARHRAIRRSVEAGFDSPGQTDWVTGCALAVRAPLWESLGGLDERYYIYSEDVDFCLRARGAGAGVAYVPQARLAHAVSASVGGAFSPFKAYHRTRARRQLARRHAHGLMADASGLVQDLALAAMMLMRGAPRSAGAVFEAIFESAGGAPRHPTTELRPGA